jgi:hypothetical protein
MFQSSNSFYSANGKLKTTISKKLSAGSHQINFKKGTLANGVYFVELKTGSYKVCKKFIFY